MVKISVVMSVFNGAPALAQTMDSILGQTEPAFELIVIDDGSTDETPAILNDYAARDARVRVIAQANTGLTRALIRGCEEARADVIARHDAADTSHPERFAKQLALLEEGHVLVSCATRVVDPAGDTLYFVRTNAAGVHRSLLEDPASRIRGVVHGSAMFRRDAYLAAGGYRAEFRVAQDLDLWIRLARRGSFAATDEVLYDMRFDEKSISGSSRSAQVQLTKIAVALRDGGDARTLLEQASRVTRKPRTKRSEAAALYFMGKCLLQQNNRKGWRYVREALRRDPLHWRAWASLLLRR